MEDNLTLQTSGQVIWVGLLHGSCIIVDPGIYHAVYLNSGRSRIFFWGGGGGHRWVCSKGWGGAAPGGGHPSHPARMYGRAL